LTHTRTGDGTQMIRADEIKNCCALLYSNDLVRLLVGESLHPGGLELTRRTGELLALSPGRKLLDVACGPGASAIWLAREFGCEVRGVDYAKRGVAAARHAATATGLSERARFLVGDAERLPLPDSSFDAVICECSFCTFPDKPVAVREIFRVLAPGGRFALSDLVRTGPIPAELQGLFAWVACIADAWPVEEYRSLLEECAFEVELVERHDALLGTLVDGIRRRLVGAQLASGLGKLELPGLDLAAAAALARSAADAIEDGRLGYALVVATKPSTESG
jgi:arsenite methyltransferase